MIAFITFRLEQAHILSSEHSCKQRLEQEENEEEIWDEIDGKSIRILGIMI